MFGLDALKGTAKAYLISNYFSGDALGPTKLHTWAMRARDRIEADHIDAPHLDVIIRLTGDFMEDGT